VNDHLRTKESVDVKVTIRPACSDFSVSFESPIMDQDYYIMESAFGRYAKSEFDPKLVKGQANCPVTCSLKVNGRRADETDRHIDSFCTEEGVGAITYDADLGSYGGK
jgi:hypothetical protein